MILKLPIFLYYVIINKTKFLYWGLQMLKSLKVENVALIEEENIEFFSGLNVLSGETGAGKSIIIK